MTLQAKRLLGFLALLAATPLGQALANDRDLRATPVSAASCAPRLTGTLAGFDPWNFGTYELPPSDPAGQGYREMILICPLPVNHIDLGGTSNDNDISSFRILYRDGDGFGVASDIWVKLFEQTLSGSTSRRREVCVWHSNADGSGAGTGWYQWTSATKTCPLDLAAGASYWFEMVII
jgi:hypothetical protein